jgi:hypothetical protein
MHFISSILTGSSNLSNTSGACSTSVGDSFVTCFKIKGNFINSGVYKEPKSGALYFFAEWPKEIQEKNMELGFKVSTQERQTRKLIDTGAPVPIEIQKYLQPDWWIPTDGQVAKIAQGIQKDKTGILEKSRDFQ